MIKATSLPNLNELYKAKPKSKKSDFLSTIDEFDVMMTASSIRVFVTCDDNRIDLDVGSSETIGDLRERVREAFEIGPDEGPAGVEMQEKKILTLTYAGADLKNDWYFSDLGITSGSTLKAVLRDEIKPTIYVYSVFNDTVVPILEKITFTAMRVMEFRGLVSRKTGLPVGIFRLLNNEGMELYDMHTLDVYGIELGYMLKLETWDGWNDFLNLAMMGFASHMMENISSEEVESRYQLKVALYMAAHFGHVDLAVSLLRLGVRADEPIGSHPARLWCKTEKDHIDNYRAPVHVAAEAGQLGVLRSFVHHNVCNVLAKDGHDLTPLNIALRKKQKGCASFLLTKQWSKITYTKKHSVPLSIYVKMKRWSDKARDRTYLLQGQSKSSLKNPKRNPFGGALVGQGLQLDGYSKSKMSSKPMLVVQVEEEEENRRNKRLWNFDEEDRDPAALDPSVYFKSLSQMQSLKFPKISKWGKIMSKATQEASEKAEMKNEAMTILSDSGDHRSGTSTPDPKPKAYSQTESIPSKATILKLPPIKEASFIQTPQNLDQTHQNEVQMSKTEAESLHALKTTPSRPGIMIRTGNTTSVGASTPTKASMSSFSEHPKTKDNSTSSGDFPLNSKKKKRGEHSLKASQLVSKAKASDSSIPLPIISVENSPRPFVHDKHSFLTQGTLQLFRKYRGMESRDYAIKCLSVANTFKERPWLQQVHQAMAISSKGVKKVVNRQPHLFTAELNKTSLGTIKDDSSSSEESSMSTSVESYATAL